MSRDNKIAMYVMFGLVMLIYVMTGHSGSTASGGTDTCEREYASDSNPVMTHDQFMTQCTKDFDNYNSSTH